MIIAKMGGTLTHWLGFQENIGRSFMMNEDSLKYPLADYLVNDGGENIHAVDLEYPHPNFPDRHIDLTITDNILPGRISSEKLENAFEFKLAKTETRHLKEKKRIFNDIIRMHLARHVTKKNCYFIIAGKSIHFERDFRNFPQNNTTKFYKEWFSFEEGKPLTFDVALKNDPVYRPIYNSFVADYESTYQGTETLILPNQITTKCEYVSVFKKNYVPYMTGIWSIE